jgi:hypothetical protein
MSRIARYAWAFFPGTVIGLVCVVVAVVSGGRWRVVAGSVEVWGGVVTLFLRRGLPWLGGGAAAMTLGHVILGRDEGCLDHSRVHEQVHVRQYERWGPAFLPAYFAASGWVWLHGGDAYLDNPFEREAYEEAARRRGRSSA